MSTTDAERELLVGMVREFAAERIRPIAEELDETERFPAEIYEELGGLGLLGITVPEDLGGPGGSTLDYAKVMEELAYGYASVADQCGVVELVASLLTKFGTPEQQQRWLPGLMAGTQRCAYALTEAEAGSDLGNLKSIAARTDDGGWILSGEKVYIHNAPVADVALVLAITDKTKGKRGGMSMFLVDCALPGVTKAYHEHKMGQRASQVGGFVFQDVELGPDALLGEEGTGFGAVLSVLEKGRVGIAALALGVIRAALDASVEHATTRVQFGKPIADFQATGFKLADMATDYHAARLLIEDASRKIDAGSADAGPASSMAKLFASEASIRVTSAAVQVHGGSGYIRGVLAERLYRDARITTIYEGTSEIQRLIISRGLTR
jgi:alkylation response protein AidB-like acyl-CoA dehydrogenase